LATVTQCEWDIKVIIHSPYPPQIAVAEFFVIEPVLTDEEAAAVPKEMI
jgi:hypothetical protein